MATVHREPNQVKWVGVRPGHNGDQFIYSGETAVVGYSAIVEVPADYMFFLTYAAIWSRNLAAANYSLSIFDDTPAFLHYIIGGASGANICSPASVSNFDPPWEIEAGNWLYVGQNVNTLVAYCLHGWVAPV